MNGTEPQWVPLFLSELRAMAERKRRCNVSLAADKAGVSRRWLYRFRSSRNGQSLRQEWETILVQARNRHSPKTTN
jgi:hypothetical protein